MSSVTTSFIQASPAFSTIASPSASPKKQVPLHPDNPNIKWIDNAERIKRARRLLYTDSKQEYAYKSEIKIPKSVYSRETTPVPLEFNFNVESLLNKCIVALKEAGFPVKAKVFKGGAIHYVMDGFPASLRDFDVSLVIDPPPGNAFAQWQKINETILRCLEQEAGLTRILNADNSITYSCPSKNILFNMPIIFTRDGCPKSSLFEHVGGLENFWWWGRKRELREDGEEYALYAIPALPCRVELEVVAKHKNSATCSLDALRLHYKEGETDDKVTAWMTAEVGYDVHKACSLRRKRLFYCLPDSIPTIREGLFRYCSHLLKGFMPTELAFEKDFCKAFFKDKALLKYFPESLPTYLRNHTSSKEDRIRYLLNLDAIFSRYKDITDAQILPYRMLIAKFLFAELGTENLSQKPEEVVWEMQLMRDYLYLHLSKNRFFHAYDKQELCCLDDPRGREYGSFVVEAPTADTLKQYLEIPLNTREPLLKLCALFPHPETNVEAFFNSLLKPKIEPKSESKETHPSFFPDFSSFLEYLNKYPEFPLKKCAKQLQDLFSFKVKSLESLSPKQKEEVRKVLSKTLSLLKTNEKSLVVSLCIEAFKSNLLKVQEKEKIGLDLINSLINPFSQKDFKSALAIFKQLASDSEISFETLRVFFQLLINSDGNPKELFEIFGHINFEPAKVDQQVELFESILKKIYVNPEYHSQFMIFWRMWNGFCDDCPQDNASLIAATKKFTDLTIQLFRASKDRNTLYWAHEIEARSSSPLLQPIKALCQELVNQWIDEGNQRIIPFYMQLEHSILRNVSEKEHGYFIRVFSSFIRGAFPCLENLQQTESALRRGIELIINNKIPAEAAISILKHLDRASQDKTFPPPLHVALKVLRKYAHPAKSEEKFSPLTLKQIKKSYFDGKDDAYEKCLDLIRILVQSKTIDLKDIYADGLDLLEEGLKRLSQAPKTIELLPLFRDIILKNKDWTPEQKLRLKDCFTQLTAKLNTKSKIEKNLDAIRTEVNTLPKEKIRKLVAHYEEMLKSNPEGNLEIWGKLLILYLRLEDFRSILRCTNNVIRITGPSENISTARHFQGLAYWKLGYIEQGVRSFEEAYKQTPDDFETIYSLADLYVYNENWSKALELFTILRKDFKDSRIKTPELLHAIKVAELCQSDQYQNAIALINKRKMVSVKEVFLLCKLHENIKADRSSLHLFEKLNARFDDSHPIILNRIGLIYVRLEERQKAIETFTKVCQLPNGDAREACFAQAVLGEMFCLSKEWFKSVCHFAEAVSRSANLNEQILILSNPQFHFSILKYIQMMKDKPYTVPDETTALDCFIFEIKMRMGLGEKCQPLLKAFSELHEIFTLAMKMKTDPSESSQSDLDNMLFKAFLTLSEVCRNKKNWHHELECLKISLPFIRGNHEQLSLAYANAGICHLHLSQFESALPMLYIHLKSTTSITSLERLWDGIDDFLITWRKLPPKIQNLIKDFLRYVKDSSVLDPALIKKIDAFIDPKKTKKR